MPTLIVLFNLKPGQSAAEYEHWAKTIDVPTVKALRSVDDFRVYRSRGLLGTNDPAPYQYFEVIQINSMNQLLSDISADPIPAIAAKFQEFADNPTFIVTDQFA